ncbi:MAG: hypothetical protein MI741_17905 [Rhodospirillales bacterium]|nr:hypothetical protein [Rhodospirillales bacterium]
MTRFLASDTNPSGFKLEEILRAIRKDILKRCEKIVDDPAAEAQQVMNNNMRILNLLSDAILIAENSSEILKHGFGPSQADDGGPPRVGRP